MQIRSAVESDYIPLMKLYNEFVGSDRYSNYNNDSFKTVLKSENNFIYVAGYENKIIGFISFSVRYVVRYPKPIAELDELFVNLKYRKKGTGKLLMQTVEEKAKELHCYRMFIESHYDHKAAHAFYESLDYTNCGYHFIKNL